MLKVLFLFLAVVVASNFQATARSAVDEGTEETQRIRVEDWPNSFDKVSAVELPGAIVAAAFSADGKTLAVSDGTTKTVDFLDATTGNKLSTASVTGSAVQGMRYKSDGKYLMFRTAEFSPTLVKSGVTVWSVGGKKTVWELGHRHNEPEDHLCAADDSPDGRYLAAADERGRVQLWSLQEEKVVQTLEGHGRVHEVVFSVDGHHLLSLGDGGKVILWETNSGLLLLEQTFADRAPVQVGFSPTGTPVATVPKEKGGYRVVQLKAAGQAREGKEGGRQNEEGILDDLGSQLLSRFSAGWAWPNRREAISPDGQRAITPIAGPCFAFLVIVPKNPQEAVTIAVDQFDAVQQGFTWDSRFAYAVIAEDLARGPGERSYSLAFWDAKTGKPAGRICPPKGITAGIQWSPDGRQVLMMSDKRVWLWRDLSLPLK